MRLHRAGLFILLSGIAALLLALDCSRQFSNREIPPSLRAGTVEGRLGPLTSGRGGLQQRQVVRIRTWCSIRSLFTPRFLEGRMIVRHYRVRLRFSWTLQVTHTLPETPLPLISP